MENQENQSTEKLTKDEFFKQMKTLIEAAPKEVTFSVIALESMQSKNDLKEGLISAQGSPFDITFAFSEAFRRSSTFKKPFLKRLIFSNSHQCHLLQLHF